MSEDYPHLDVYKWSHNLSTEQDTPYDEGYIWAPELKRLLRRLKLGSNNMVAVIGNQGSGKTAARENLLFELQQDLTKTTKSVKWRDVDTMFDAMIDGDNMVEYHHSVITQGNEAIRRKNLRKGIRSWGGRPEETDFEKSEAMLTQTELRKLKYDALIFAAASEKGATFLIDFPDYDKKSRGQMLRDLASFREWWDELTYNSNYTSNVNIVIFFQKELWGGHFSFGKFDVVELKPFSPLQMVILYERIFGSPEPFDEDALEYLGGLARGIIRWYKKYIRLCLDQLYDNIDRRMDPELITVENVKAWVTLDQLADDWERELMEVFPKSRGLRRKAVEIMRFLFEEKEVPQTKLMTQFFGDDGAARTGCSRLLSKLEEYDYITRVPGGREKIIKLVTPYE